MAFNPFRRFRKHQKIIIAGITILCMVTFVMCGSMGKGDFFETIAHTFTGRSRGEVVATMYGKDITAKEVRELRAQRGLASQYMKEVIVAWCSETCKLADEGSQKWEPELRKLIQRLVLDRMLVLRFSQF